MNRVSIYPSGELTVRSVMVNGQSPPPPPRYGPRMTLGCSRHGSRQIRRASMALVKSQPCQTALYTLSSQDAISDEVFTHRLNKFLKWGRQYLAPYFEFYAWTLDLQQRGNLHAHLLLFKRIPNGLWRRMRNLWAVQYGMGAGSLDVRTIRKPSRAAHYMSKAANYVSKRAGDKPECYRVSLSEGGLDFEPWRKSRHNGLPYERIVFRGNAHGVSDALRYFTKPVTEFWMDWGTGHLLDAITLEGKTKWFDSVESAEDWLSSALDPPVSPTPAAPTQA